MTDYEVGDKIIVVKDDVYGNVEGRTFTIVRILDYGGNYPLTAVDESGVKYAFGHHEVRLAEPKRDSFLDAVSGVIDDQGREGFDDTEALVRIMRLIVREERKRR